MSPNPGAGALGARLLLGATLAMGVALGGTSPAFAAPGDNGTVKIHDPSTSEDDNRNEPKVCDFQIVADHFDAGQEISWRILAKGDQGWNKKEPVLEGDLVLDEEGSGSTEILELDNGHYKLKWNFEGEKGEAKHKVFKVDCEEDSDEPEPTPSPTPGETPSTPPVDEGTESPDPTDPPETEGPEETEEPTGPAAPDETTGDDDSAADEGNAPAEETTESSLAVTGSALTALVAAGAVAVAGGGAAVYFTRKRKNAADAQE